MNALRSRVIESIFEEAVLLVPTQSQSVPRFDEQSSEDDNNAIEYLSTLKNFIFESSSKGAIASRQAVAERCLKILYQLVCLVLEDVKLSQWKFANCAIYTDAVLGTISSVYKGPGYYIHAIDTASGAKGRLLARRRNLVNNPDQEDFVLRMNFLNKLNDLETSLASIKEMMLMSTLWQHCDFRARARKVEPRGPPPLTESDDDDIYASEESLSDTSLELLENNINVRRDKEENKKIVASDE